MSRLVAVLATVACMFGLAVAPAPPVAADSTEVGGSQWSVTLTFSDLQLSSAACQFVPVTAVVTGDAVESWTFGGFVTPKGAGEDYGFNWYIDYDKMVRQGTGTFRFRHEVMMCSGADGFGSYAVEGEVGVQMAGATEWTWAPYRATFTISGIPTSTTLEAIAASGPDVIFSGRAVAVPPSPALFKGCGEDWLNIEVLTDGGWEEVGSSEPAEDGSFLVTVPRYRLTGTQYRARFSGGSLCESSTSAPRALPFRLPTARVSSVSRESKLKVDIDPNMGRRAWVFQVQRRTDDGAWKTMRTYRTRGAGETRTLNLRKGEYRIRVKARFGYVETYSDTVTLAR